MRGCKETCHTVKEKGNLYDNYAPQRRDKTDGTWFRQGWIPGRADQEVNSTPTQGAQYPTIYSYAIISMTGLCFYCLCNFNNRLKGSGSLGRCNITQFSHLSQIEIAESEVLKGFYSTVVSLKVRSKPLCGVQVEGKIYKGLRVELSGWECWLCKPKDPSSNPQYPHTEASHNHDHSYNTR